MQFAEGSCQRADRRPPDVNARRDSEDSSKLIVLSSVSVFMQHGFHTSPHTSDKIMRSKPDHPGPVIRYTHPGCTNGNIDIISANHDTLTPHD